MEKKYLQFETDMKFEREFQLKQAPGTLSMTTFGLAKSIFLGNPFLAIIDEIKQTSQVFKSRSIVFFDDGTAIFKCELTDIGYDFLMLLDCESGPTIEEKMSYKTIVENIDGRDIYKIILLNKDGLVYGTYFSDKALTALITVDIFSEETYLSGDEDTKIEGLAPQTAFDMQKVGCWFRWFDGEFPYKWSNDWGKAYLDVKYGEKERNVLDLYAPANFDPKKENGIIIHIHGGGWLGGNKTDYQSQCSHYTKLGYFTATINYSFISLEKQSSMFTILDEIIAALAKIKSMSDENGWNITKAAMTGGSAGGHLSMLHAYSQNEKGAIPVLFVAELVGPIDMRANAWANLVSSPDPQYLVFAADGSGQKMTIEEIKSGKGDDLLLKVSPINYVNTAVPTIMGHGLFDTFVNPKNGQILSAELDKLGIRNDYVEYSNSGHMLTLDSPQRRRFFELFDQYLKDFFGY